MTDQDDVLSRMSRALGEENPGESEQSAATRARILTSLGGSRVPSQRRPWIPVLLLLGIGTSAWASQSTGVQSWLSEITSADSAAENPSAARAPVEAARPVRTEGPALDTPTQEVPVEVEPRPQQLAVADQDERASALAASTPQPRTPASSAPQPSAQSTAPHPSSGTSSDLGLATYQSAHRAQFAAGDCRAAIEGYGRYLAAHPSGTFEPEARYNSALCSISLGDHAAARRALRPFADGAYGAYRRDRALQLLEAIGP